MKAFQKFNLNLGATNAAVGLNFLIKVLKVVLSAEVNMPIRVPRSDCETPTVVAAVVKA